MKYLHYSILLLIVFLSAKSDKTGYNEKYRPQYHFSPQKNWLFEPAGFVKYKGEYHLFFHNVSISNKIYEDQLGHAVSKDLIHWQQLPFAFSPNDKPTTLSAAPPMAGCAVVDSMNVTGLKQNEEKPILIFYADSIGNQNLAYSNDKGLTWSRYAKNPILFVPEGKGHDPKVFYHAPSGKWILALYRTKGDGSQKAGISFFSSADLLNWKYCSHLEGFGECPDLFEVSFEGKPNEKKYVAISGEGDYKIGLFDGQVFKPETGMQKLDFGKNFYGAQTLLDAPAGKVIQIAWMRGGEFPEMAFNGQMNFPTELSLRITKKGTLLCRKPIAALSSLYNHELQKKDKNLIPGLNGNLVSGISGDALFIKAVFQPKTSDSFGFIVRNGKQSSGTDLHYDTVKKILEANGIKMPLEQVDGKIELEILVDRSSIEIFANHGESGISTCFSPPPGEDALQLYTLGGELFVESLEAHTLKSAWLTK